MLRLHPSILACGTASNDPRPAPSSAVDPVAADDAVGERRRDEIAAPVYPAQCKTCRPRIMLSTPASIP